MRLSLPWKAPEVFGAAAPVNPIDVSATSSVTEAKRQGAKVTTPSSTPPTTSRSSASSSKPPASQESETPARLSGLPPRGSRRGSSAAAPSETFVSAFPAHVEQASAGSSTADSDGPVQRVTVSRPSKAAPFRTGAVPRRRQYPRAPGPVPLKRVTGGRGTNGQQENKQKIVQHAKPQTASTNLTPKADSKESSAISREPVSAFSGGLRSWWHSDPHQEGSLLQSLLLY